jgi:stage II sporulation protein AB (anti-sigma F factor)
MQNKMSVRFESLPVNEGFARMTVGAFMSLINPTLEELSDVKTAVSEAVTNAVIHGYGKNPGIIELKAKIDGSKLYISVRDWGGGIEDIKLAMEPLFTTKPDEDRSGMGFAFMEAFMDGVSVESEIGQGTTVSMWKEIGTTGQEYE